MLQLTYWQFTIKKTNKLTNTIQLIENRREKEDGQTRYKKTQYKANRKGIRENERLKVFRRRISEKKNIVKLKDKEAMVTNNGGELTHVIQPFQYIRIEETNINTDMC